MRHERAQAMRGIRSESLRLRPHRAARPNSALRILPREQAYR